MNAIKAKPLPTDVGRGFKEEEKGIINSN